MQTVSVPAGTTEVFPAYTIPPGTPLEVEEIRSMVEEVQTNIVFIDLVNYANHGLSRLEIKACLKDVPGTHDVPMQRAAPDSPPVGTVDFILPLTTYTNCILQFQVKKVFQSAPEQTTRWLEWDVERLGSVVSITWEMIA
jgi:hypothetical protein